MKYKATQYADALVEALEGADQETSRTRIRTFIELLKRHQMLGKADSIVRAAVRKLAARAGMRRVVLQSADAPSETLRKEITDLFDGKVWLEEKVQPDLLAGIRVLIDDEILVDASGKQQLTQMFRIRS